MGASDLVVMDTEELEGRLEESRRELFNLRFQLATGQLDNTARMRTVRKDVARILTVLRERDISEYEAVSAADALEDEPLFTPARRRVEEAAAPEAAADPEAHEAGRDEEIEEEA